MNRSCRPRTLRLIGVALALLVARVALAQDHPIVFLRISEADFRRMLDHVPTDAPETAAAVYQRFAADFAREMGLMLDRIKTYERTRVKDSWQRINADWWDKRLELEARLASDVDSVLNTTAEHAAWSRAVADERRRYVFKELKFEQRRREQFDPLVALEAITPAGDESQRLQASIDVHATAMDQALQHWQREHIRITRAMEAIPDDSDDSRQRRLALIDEWTSSSDKVAAACTAAMNSIADALDPEHREAFLDGIDRQVYPEAFERCPAELAFEALGQVPGIPPEQRVAIDAIYADYAPKRDEIRRQVIKAIRQYQEGDNPLKREMDELWAAVERGEVDIPERNRRSAEIRMKHPANIRLQTRHDLGIEAVRRMRSVFSADDIARFPLAVRLALTAW